MTRVAVPKFDTFVKIIRDPIHGNIPLTRLESDILQLPAIFRLHDIKQTGLAHFVFPGAVGTRFTHSIGTMHLASLMAHQLLESMDHSIAKELFPGYSVDDLRPLVQLVRLAALLHDVGHGAFSHNSEDSMRYVMGTARYRAEFETAMNTWHWKETDASPFPVHEYFSTQLIVAGEIGRVISAPHDKESDVGPDEVAALISKNPLKSGKIADPGIKILQTIISSDVDADRMDYLVRDAHASGIPYGLIDPYRLISQMFVKPYKGTQKVCFHARALGGLEDFLDGRYKMYKWFVGHHMVQALGQLLREAFTWSLAEGVLKPETFHWQSFDVGDSSDGPVMSQLAVGLATKMNEFHGLIDRRYFPVSLMKSLTDWQAFQEEVQEQMGRGASYDSLKPALVKFIDELVKHPEVQVAGKDLHMFVVPVARTPYRQKAVGEGILVYDSRGELQELTRASPYVCAINTEWMEYPSYYISYCEPGEKKVEASKIRDAVRSEMVRRAAS